MLKKLTLLLCSLCLMAPAFANDSAQSMDRVSVIIFTQKSQSNEQWPIYYQAPNLQNTLDLSPATNPPAADQTLPMQDFPLNKEMTALQNQGSQVLVATSWLQPAIQDTKWIHLQGGQTYGADSLPLPTETTLAPTYWQLNGKLQVSRNGAYSLGVDLFLNLPNASGAAPTGIANFHTVRLTQNLRIKTGQVVYIDQPLFGVLVLVTKA